MLVMSSGRKGVEFVLGQGYEDRGQNLGTRQSIKGITVRMGKLYDYCQQWCMEVDKVFAVRYYPDIFEGGCNEGEGETGRLGSWCFIQRTGFGKTIAVAWTLGLWGLRNIGVKRQRAFQNRDGRRPSTYLMFLRQLY
jgi:hypothetical protein